MLNHTIYVERTKLNKACTLLTVIWNIGKLEIESEFSKQLNNPNLNPEEIDSLLK